MLPWPPLRLLASGKTCLYLAYILLSVLSFIVLLLASHSSLLDSNLIMYQLRACTIQLRQLSTMSMRYSTIQTHESAWQAGHVQVTLNVSLDACFVPSETHGTRLDTAHLVCLDNFIDEDIRRSLLEAITQPGWEIASGAPPSDKWEVSTADTADAPRTWGLKHEALEAFERSDLWAKLEVQSRLAKLYPEVIIMHQPSDAIQCTHGVHHQADLHNSPQEQHQAAASQQGPLQEHANAVTLQGGSSMPQPADASPQSCDLHHAFDAAPRSMGESQPSQMMSFTVSVAQAVDTGQVAVSAIAEEAEAAADMPASAMASMGTTTYDCHAILANAAARGDEFAWHQDADPQTFDVDSAFTRAYGHYTNREPGKPLFVSLLLYLNDTWPRDWAADTLFLDTPSDTGIIVRPKPYRVVIMDQDILHRLSAPYRPAGHTPRYSLVWKLVFLPKVAGQHCSIARPEWGEPDAFGSAAKARAMVQQLARKRKAPTEQA